jgi:ABC-type uncharacterized transport system substrate-binding protein
MQMATLLQNILRIFIVLLALTGAAQAHPHVWITFKSELLYAPDGTLTGIRHAWSFDDMFSAFALQGIQSKEKGKFTREELAALAEVNVSSLKEFGYFTFVTADGKKIELTDPAKNDAVKFVNKPERCGGTFELPRELTFQEQKALAQIPADQQNTTMAWGAQFANKIKVTCK